MDTTANTKIPETNTIEDIQFGDIFKVEDIQRMQDLFSDATGVASLITYPDGAAITKPSNFCRLCENIILKTEKGRANCKISELEIRGKSSSHIAIQPCLSSGLWDAGVRITVGGKHLANWLIGQVRNGETDGKRMLQYADEIGANREDFMDALNEVPVMSVKQFNKVTEMLCVYTNELSEKAYSNLQLKRQIAERERATQLLQESEESFSATLHSIGDAVLSTNNNGLIVNINPKAAFLCGWATEDAIGKTLSEVFKIVNPDSRQVVADPVKKVLETGQMQGLANHTILISKQGSEYQIANSAAPIKNKNGEINGVVLVFSDVTEKYQTEKALRESERSKSVLLSNLPGMAYRCRFDPEWTMEFVSEGFHNLTGYKAEDILLNRTLSYNDLILTEYREHLWQVWELAVHTHGIICEEYRILTADKQEKWVWEQGIPIYNEAGEVEALEGLILDITERKLAEETIYNERLLLRTIIDNIPDAIYTKDLECRKTLSNLTEVRLIGAMSEADVLGKDDFEYHPKELAEKFIADDMAVIQTGHPMLNKEGFMYDKDKKKRWLVSSKLPLYDKDNQIIGLVGIGHDITERKLAEIALGESETLYHNLIEKMPDGVYKSTPEGKFVDVNPAMVKMLGYMNKEELMAIDIKTQLYFEPSDRESLILQEQLEEMGVYRLRRKDGSEIWVEDHGWYNTDEKGNVIFHEGIMRDVTERKKAEETLMKSEERHRTIIQTALDGFWLLDMQGRILEVNESYCRMSGYNEQELLTKNISDLEVVEAVEDAKDLLQMITAEGENRFEAHHRHKDGSIFDLETSVQYLPDEGGRLVVFMHNITERNKAEIALKKSEKLFQTLAESSPVGIFRTRDDGYTTYVSPKWSQLSGLSFVNALGDGWLKAVHQDDKEILKTGWQIATKNLGPSYSEYRFVRPDGTIVWVIGQAIPEMNSENEIIGYIGTITDNTDRKLAIEALMESEEKLRTVFNTMEEGLALNEFLFNEHGDIVDYRILEVNPAFERILGMQREQVTGRLATDLYQMNQGNITDLGKTYLDDDRPNRTEVYDDKLDRWKLVSNSHTIGNKFVTSFFDITERKKIEIELIVAKEHAEESDRLKSAFLANMSHEIRTPMNGILGFAELLKTPNLSGAEQMEYIRIIKKSGDRMLNIINDIVDISKIEAGQVKVFISETKINEQTEFLYSFFKPEVEKKGIQLILRNGLPGNEAVIKTDKEKVYAVLTNLIKNAIKFTNNGSIEIGYKIVAEETLHATSLHATSLLQFYVKDTGSGIPTDRQHAIFDRFVQADIADTRAFQGAGLGLSISKAYVEMLNGKMWVESEEGKGSTFYFTIPYTAESKQKPSGQTNTLNNENSQNKKLKILIVEDDETSEMLISIAVRTMSKEILKVRAGADAIAACRANPDIDLILMDVKMPEMDGYEATRQIRQFNKDVYIIAQTAFGLVDEKVKAIDSGCNEYISKPLDIAVLKGLIQKHFNPVN